MRFVVCLLLSILCVRAHAGDVARVEAMLAGKAAAIDLAEAKMAIDVAIDPRVDVTEVRAELDAWTERIEVRMPMGATIRQRVDVVLSTLYVAGEWNDFRPFAYDLDDPFALRPENRLLATYLETRRGNCVSMPVLLAILGTRLGLPMFLAKAPNHLFVKYRDDDGAWHNFEATSGGYKGDASYIRETGISERAVANGVYLRPLDVREAAATLAGDLVQSLADRGDHNRAMRVAQRIHTANPHDVDAMVRVGSLHASAMTAFHARWPDPADVPAKLHARYRAHAEANRAWFARAEARGWVEPAESQNAAYLRDIELERDRRGAASR
jgi:regulator of sirC expression with transglutaminase-like and TPR domain